MAMFKWVCLVDELLNGCPEIDVSEKVRYLENKFIKDLHTHFPAKCDNIGELCKVRVLTIANQFVKTRITDSGTQARVLLVLFQYAMAAGVQGRPCRAEIIRRELDLGTPATPPSGESKRSASAVTTNTVPQLVAGPRKTQTHVTAFEM